MENKTIIAPSLIAADMGSLRHAMEQVDKAGAQQIHLDIMDGHFVPSMTFGARMVRDLRPHSRSVFDVHLMVATPSSWVDMFIAVGGDIISFHVEACAQGARDALPLLARIRQHGKKAGIALNPETPVRTLAPLLPMLDHVIIMGVHPGRSGQAFIPSTMEKIRELKALSMSSSLSFAIEVDGGVCEENAAALVSDGADMLVGGSSIFSAGIEHAAASFHRLCRAASTTLLVT